MGTVQDCSKKGISNSEPKTHTTGITDHNKAAKYKKRKSDTGRCTFHVRVRAACAQTHTYTDGISHALVKLLLSRTQQKGGVGSPFMMSS